MSSSLSGYHHVFIAGGGLLHVAERMLRRLELTTTDLDKQKKECLSFQCRKHTESSMENRDSQTSSSQNLRQSADLSF
ncbi:hypothetical protein EUGRSUZ_G02503 [Eucalyptus grandis]|uniref:Uncharacterized protein n=2 Tax=Eucalyptus grandis TaxID=71139 RepID=A0ACC3K5Z3_EUCGR|nr:hypothetical protein EUGRSUZ_G02503 [Eucalyptus grandis]